MCLLRGALGALHVATREDCPERTQVSIMENRLYLRTSIASPHRPEGDPLEALLQLRLLKQLRLGGETKLPLACDKAKRRERSKIQQEQVKAPERQ